MQYRLMIWRIFTFFSKDCILFAVLCREDGEEPVVCIDYVDIERHLEFPEPNLKLELSGDELVITAERFARCVRDLPVNRMETSSAGCSQITILICFRDKGKR